MSVAANLAWREVAEPAPSKKMPRSKSGKDLNPAAFMTVIAPAMAKPAPRARDTLLPLA
jgi:hypothetical protein